LLDARTPTRNLAIFSEFKKNNLEKFGDQKKKHTHTHILATLKMSLATKKNLLGTMELGKNQKTRGPAISTKDLTKFVKILGNIPQFFLISQNWEK
jgi:hypothetical protein